VGTFECTRTRTRNPRVTSHGSRRVGVSSGVLLTKIHLFNYILNYNYQTTLRAGARRRGVDRRWAQDARLLGQRNEKKRKKKKPKRRVSPGPVPLSLVVSPPPHLLRRGRLCGGPRCGWCWWCPWWWCPPIVPSPFAVFSLSPPMEHPASSCSQRCHRGPTPDDVAHGVAL
jgi:hypothetical protein